MRKAKVPVISFVAAKSGTGKTTLLEKVVRLLKADGIRLAVIKHDAHRFEIDQPGKDTWRFWQAGADVVAISSREKTAVIEKTAGEKALDDIIATLPAVDLILTEGFKRAGKPKIEVLRAAVQRELLFPPEELLAVASDFELNVGVPCFHIDDARGVAEEIKRYMKKFGKGRTL